MTAVLRYQRPNPIVEFLVICIKAPIKLSLNTAIFLILTCILFKPAHNIIEGVYTSSNFVSRVRAWIPSLSLPSVKTEIKSTSYKGLTKEQSNNVKAIIQTGKDMSMSDHDIKLALMAASQESNLRALDHGDDWFFAKYGEKSDSLGLFQQRSVGWGSKQCRLNPSCSSKLFYNALKSVTNRSSMPEWEAIARVQRPAKQYEQEYQKWSTDASVYLKQTGKMKISESIKLPTLKSIDVLNWLGTRKDSESHLDSSIKGKYVLMTATNRIDQFGGKIYRVAKVNNNQVLDTKDAVSGNPGKTNRNSKTAGSGEPLPIGQYQIGEPERGNFNPAIGSLWMSLHPLTDVGSRGNFGIHTDNNRYASFGSPASPGSAGCLAMLSDKDTEDLANWQKEGYKTLVVAK